MPQSSCGVNTQQQVTVQKSSELRALTGFRFLAAFYVFVFHVHIRWPLFDDGYLANFLSQGAVGMAMFFMLSGFILAYRYGSGPFDSKQYLWNRFARIYPIYALAAILATPILFIQISGGGLRFGMLSVAAQCIALVFAGMFMIQAWIPMMFSYLNNNASWSLSVEAFFYVMFVPVIALVKDFNLKSLWICLVGVYALALFPPFAYYAFENRPVYGLQIFYVMPVFRLGEFLIGVLTYLLWRQHGLKLTSGVTWLAFCLVLISGTYLAILGPVLPLYVGHNWIMIPTIALMLVVLASNRSFVAQLLGSSPAVWLGRISYCFYSFQVHVLWFMKWLDKKIELQSGERFAIALILLLAISAAGYHFIEEPARRWLQRRYRLRKLEQAVA